jgi:hypothetical protein
MVMRGIDLLTIEHLEGLSSLGVIWVELAYGTKHTIRKWDYYIEQQQHHKGALVDLAAKILRKGNGLGYLVHGDAWVLDLDTVTGTTKLPMLERFEDVCAGLYLTPPLVHTPSMGLHSVFKLPPELMKMPLKNHICHPMEDDEQQEWDFKLGPNTLMVAPGTVNDKGIYTPLTRWQDPPVLDPRVLAPQIELFKDQRPFLIDNRDKESRIIAAQQYLRHHAHVSHSKQNGHQTLFDVAIMLVVYRDLDPEFAFHLMTHEAPGKLSWNERCIGEDGKPYPWSASELWAALESAKDAAPIVGIQEYETAMEDHELRWLIASFIEILRLIPPHTGKPAMAATDLFRAFQQMFGLTLPDGMVTVFGWEIRLAMLQGSLPLKIAGRKGINHYIGVDASLLAAAKTQYEAQQRLFGMAR